MRGHQQEPPATKPAPKAPGPSAAAEPGSRIGAGIRIKGAVGGDSDVYVDGEIEGSLTLPENALIVGPAVRVRAQVKARTLIVWGYLEGKVQATEKIEIRQSGMLLGDLVTAQIVIEDGAAFHGSVEISKPGTSEKTRPPARPPARAATRGAPRRQGRRRRPATAAEGPRRRALIRPSKPLPRCEWGVVRVQADRENASTGL